MTMSDREQLPMIVGRIPERLQLCFNCSSHFRVAETDCPFCGANAQQVMLERMKAYEDAFAILRNMVGILGRAIASAEQADQGTSVPSA
jgi:hypothetical protein